MSAALATALHCALSAALAAVLWLASDAWATKEIRCRGMVHRHSLENSGRESETAAGAKLSWVAASLSVRPRGFAGRGWVRLLTFINWANTCWATEKMSSAVGWRRMHGRLTSAKPFLWRHQPVGEPMVHRCRVVLRDHAKKCSELASDCRGFCKRWHQKWFLSASSSWAYAGVDY